jgi:hypothetical protein
LSIEWIKGLRGGNNKGPGIPEPFVCPIRIEHATNARLSALSSIILPELSVDTLSFGGRLMITRFLLKFVPCFSEQSEIDCLGGYSVDRKPLIQYSNLRAFPDGRKMSYPWAVYVQ